MWLLMYFLEQLGCHKQPRTLPEHRSCSSSYKDKGIPIEKSYRSFLRGRLTRTPPIVASKPVDFRRSGFRPDMSLLMPAESAPTPHYHLSTILDWVRALRYRMVTSIELTTSPAAAVSDFESLYIFGVFVPLGPCAVTRSPQDGCFQAHLRTVTARKRPFSLKSAL